jgi:transcriptional antiterminator RfaH
VNWYLVHTKPRQERVALENLLRQGFGAVLPMLQAEKVQRGKITVVPEPLFPRYVFTCVEDGVNWAPIRSTLGVTRLVTFGGLPAKVPLPIVDLFAHAPNASDPVTPLFTQGQRVRISRGPFAGIEGVFDMRDGEQRVMVLIELMGKPTRLPIEPTAVTPL